jgi:hypothetical protein
MPVAPLRLEPRPRWSIAARTVMRLALTTGYHSHQRRQGETDRDDDEIGP